MSNEKKPWVDGLTIGAVLAWTAERFPTNDALVFPEVGLRWTYAQFAREVDRAARGLLALGIRTGEHVAIWATNVPEWVVLQFATARIGAVLVTVNPAYRPFELKYVVKQSDSVALFLVDRFKTSNYFSMLGAACPELAHADADNLSLAEFPKLRRIVAIKGGCPGGMISWEEMLERGDTVPSRMGAFGGRGASGGRGATGGLSAGAGVDAANTLADKPPVAPLLEVTAIAAQLRPEQPINIQYTSGTTGFPKAATLSHRNLLLNAFYVGQCQRLTEADRICIPVPFYHCFGCVLGTLASAVYGAAMVVPAEYFQPAATLDAIEQARATSIYGVPTMFIAQLEDPSFGQRDLRSLRTGIMAGSPCPIEVMRKVIDRMGAREMTIAYGQTEASPVITQTRTDDPLELRVETVGRELPGVEVKIVDPATGQQLPDGQQGELCARGHVVMLGYYHNDEATAAAIDREGWLHTGDLAIRQPNGYYRITGRIKDMVIRGGENIFPREIEEFLFTHPAIEQAAVVGVPDPKYVEELCAWIKLKHGCTLTEDEVRNYCRSQLAHYKVPRYIKFTDAFPQTVTGKIQKFKIREAMCEELGLKAAETA